MKKTIEKFYEEDQEFYKIDNKIYKSLIDYDGLEDVYIPFLKLIAIMKEDIENNWNYYSKGWHRCHGPKTTITNRRIEFSDLNGKLIKKVNIERWSGDFLTKAIKNNFQENAFLKREFKRYKEEYDHRKAIAKLKRKRNKVLKNRRET